MNYWNNLEARERWLVGSALSLVLILAMVFLVIRPILDSVAKAEDRNSLYQTAQANNLEMTRLNPEADGAMKVWFEETSSQQVYKFIDDTTSKYAAIVSSAQFTRKKGGKVSVVLTFRPS